MGNELLREMEGGPRSQRKRGRENRRTNPKSGAGGKSIRENRDVKNEFQKFRNIFLDDVQYKMSSSSGQEKL